MCVTHEPMRQIEWKVYHIMRTSDLSMKEINEWLDGRVNFQGESTENNVAKPSFNYVKAATVWLEEDPLQSGIDLWESFVDFADGGREDTKDVWHAYINMRSIQQGWYSVGAGAKSNFTTGALVGGLQNFVFGRLTTPRALFKSDPPAAHPLNRIHPCGCGNTYLGPSCSTSIRNRTTS